MGKWNMHSFCSGNLERKDHLEDPGIGWKTLKLVFKKRDGRHGLDWYGSGQGHVAGSWKYGETLGLIKSFLFSQATEEGLYCMQLSSQSVSWLPIISYLVSFPCIYWRSLVLLYTQAQNTHQAFLHNAKFFF